MEVLPTFWQKGFLNKKLEYLCKIINSNIIPTQNDKDKKLVNTERELTSHKIGHSNTLPWFITIFEWAMVLIHRKIYTSNAPEHIMRKNSPSLFTKPWFTITK